MYSANISGADMKGDQEVETSNVSFVLSVLGENWKLSRTRQIDLVTISPESRQISVFAVHTVNHIQCDCVCIQRKVSTSQLFGTE